MRTLPIGATIGMLGGGQLGRMAAMEAARLGYHVHVYTTTAHSPAAQVGTTTTVASFEDSDALKRFAQNVSVATLEFENIPIATLEHLQELGCPVHPGILPLKVCQDRALEKQFVNDQGIATAPWREVHSLADVREACAELGTPAVLKRARMGYDGKGQVRLEAETNLEQAWADMGGNRGVVEGFVAFEREISVLVARGQDGAMATWPAVENIHRNHVLWRTLAPATLPDGVAAKADALARTLAEAFGYVGVLAVELFLMPDGALKVNEMASRPHNSGHWTLDASVTSQFEQQIRAVCGLPLGATTVRCPAEMTNLLGDAIHQRDTLAADPAVRIHLYGKGDVREGRKMGHVTRLLAGDAS
ncbi:MAG: 5-(carboxyamino)imidazole ribonucleotide synthase [Myxococcota bacterium]